MERFLIVNADDFGLSAGVNAGIIRAHAQGMVTSTSLMVRAPAAGAAVALASTHPKLSIGLHVDLGEWTCVNDEWRQVYEVVPNDDAAAVESEVARQLAVFQELVGRAPSHLDSHQHVHNSEPVHSIMVRAAKQLDVVLRSFDPVVRYCGDFYGQSNKGYAYHEAISPEGLLAMLNKLPPGVTEMGCHPAAVTDLDSMYLAERIVECATLCDVRVRDALEASGTRLVSFLDRAVTGR